MRKPAFRERPEHFTINPNSEGGWIVRGGNAALLGLANHITRNSSGVPLFHDSSRDHLGGQGANHGTLTNFASPFSSTSGPVWDATLRRWAWAFDGSNDLVNVPAAASLNPSSAISLSIWAYTNSVTGTGTMLHKGNTTAANPYYQWALLRTSSDIYFELQLDGVWTEKLAASIFNIGEWTHLLCCYNGATYQIFRNGISAAGPTALTGSITACDTSVGIGKATSGFTNYNYWNGMLADPLVFGADMRAYTSYLANPAWSIDYGGLIQPVRTLWPGWSGGAPAGNRRRRVLITASVA